MQKNTDNKSNVKVTMNMFSSSFLVTNKDTLVELFHDFKVRKNMNRFKASVDDFKDEGVCSFNIFSIIYIY